MRVAKPTPKSAADPQVAGPGVHLTLTCSTKVLRPDQTLEDAGLYDGSIVSRPYAFFFGERSSS